MIRCTVTGCNCRQQFGSLAEFDRHLTGKRRHKYGVSDRKRRTYGPIVYHSRAEAIRRRELDHLRLAKVIRIVVEQPRFPLGDIAYSADFLVWGWIPDELHALTGHERTDGPVHWVEDVKGHETARFKLVRKIWSKYMELPLFVLNRKGDRWVPELIPPSN